MAKMRSISKGSILLLVAIFVILIITGLVAFAFRVAYHALDAEETYQANHVILHVLKTYMRQHPGEWPANWEELSHITIAGNKQRPPFNWPKNISEFRKRFRINFSLTRLQVANMTTENFSAVEPIGPFFQVEDRWIEDLLHVARNENTDC